MITDVGFASALKSINTPRYMAPEIAEGGKPDFASDIYSFGILAEEMAIGGTDPVTPPVS